MDVASIARKAAAWLCAFLIVLSLSSSVIAHAFLAKFLDQQVYFASFEKRETYSQVQEGLVSLFASQLPSGAREILEPELRSAITPDYARGQLQAVVSSLLLYLSSEKQELSLLLDLSPIKETLSASADPGVQLMALALPPSVDFAQQAASQGQLAPLESLREQVRGLRGAISYGLLLSALLLIPLFLLQPDWQEGVRQCCMALFSCGVSTAIGGLGMALLSGPLLQLALSSASQGAEIAPIIAGILGDAMYEVGVLAALLSLPLIAFGFAVPRLLPAKNP